MDKPGIERVERYGCRTLMIQARTGYIRFMPRRVEIERSGTTDHPEANHRDMSPSRKGLVLLSIGWFDLAKRIGSSTGCCSLMPFNCRDLSISAFSPQIVVFVLTFSPHETLSTQQIRQLDSPCVTMAVISCGKIPLLHSLS